MGINAISDSTFVAAKDSVVSMPKNDTVNINLVPKVVQAKPAKTVMKTDKKGEAYRATLDEDGNEIKRTYLWPSGKVYNIHTMEYGKIQSIDYPGNKTRYEFTYDENNKLKEVKQGVTKDDGSFQVYETTTFDEKGQGTTRRKKADGTEYVTGYNYSSHWDY